MKINKNNIILAEVRYFDKEHNGLEVVQNNCYVLIGKDSDGNYYNLLNEQEKLPLLERVPYGNCMGELEYGSKVREVTKIKESGLCYLKVEDIAEYFSDLVTRKDLENYILNSNYYFREKKAIADTRKRKSNCPLIMIKRKKHNK